MKLTIESTDELVAFALQPGEMLRARVWKGRTAGGAAFEAYVALIVAQEGEEFPRELREVSIEMARWP